MYWIIKTEDSAGAVESKFLKAGYSKERIIEILAQVWEVKVISLEPDPDIQQGQNPLAPSVREDVMEQLRREIKPGN